MDAKKHEWERRGGTWMKRRFALGSYDTLVVLFGGNGF
jgi:hypothetical protein